MEYNDIEWFFCCKKLQDITKIKDHINLIFENPDIQIESLINGYLINVLILANFDEDQFNRYNDYLKKNLKEFYNGWCCK